jgi:hypothetical protein
MPESYHDNVPKADDQNAEEAIRNAEKGRELEALKDTAKAAEDVAEQVIHGVLHPAETFERGLHQDPSGRSDTVNTPKNPNAVYPGDEPGGDATSSEPGTDQAG